MRKRRYSELGTAGKVAALAIAAISLVIIGAAQRDIQRRDEDEVRGNRAVWRVVCLNALGAIVYLRFGRRRTAWRGTPEGARRGPRPRGPGGS